MDFRQQLNAVNQCGTIYDTGYKWLLFLRTLVDTHQIKAEWVDYRKQHPDLYDPPNPIEEKTFEECVNVAVNAAGSGINMVITIYDGDSYNGKPISKRCEFSVKLQEAHDDLLPLISKGLRYKAAAIIEKQDEEIYEKRMKDIIENLIK